MDVVEPLAVEVALHLGYAEAEMVWQLLLLPATSFVYGPLLPEPLVADAVRQLALDLLADAPEAISVEKAWHEFQLCQQELLEVWNREAERVYRELNEPMIEGWNSEAQSPRDQKAQALIEEIEAVKTAIGGKVLAQQRERRALETWAKSHWPSQVLFALGTPAPPAKDGPRLAAPKSLAHPTFIEARQVSHALSDGRDGRNWKALEGVIALLHCAPKAKLATRFEPSPMLLDWWGVAGTEDTLYGELARLDLDDVILFRVVLSAILRDEKARFSASLDDIITLIGRDKDARRSSGERAKWRAKVWRSIVLFDSLAVYGMRAGKWKEPNARGEKRARMDEDTLFSRDPLVRIVGTRDTQQGTFDGSAPPKAVSLVPGEWLMPLHGNREVLSEFGDVLPIAQIARGKPSGAWAACAGLMLAQIWREQASKATLVAASRGKTTSAQSLKFRPFTRRQLLADTIRSDFDVNAILNDPKGRKERVVGYWGAAIKELKARGVIGHYAELEGKPASDWRQDWLNQPLDIRPAGTMMADALEIHRAAQKARARGQRKPALPTRES